MDKQKYLDDIKDIKDIMDRSTKFISLSGLTGIVTGILALIAVYFAYNIVYTEQNYLVDRIAILSSEKLLQLIGIATLTIILSIVLGIIFTSKKANQNKQKLWDKQAKRFYMNLAIPLCTGGVLCLILLVKGYVGLVAPLTLIFYGLALVNGSHNTLSELKSLGIIEIILGVIAVYFIGYGLIFWAVGFGVMHIVYGTFMHIKYGS
jgi:predicted lysophospholipase L1 biosynthesis ABC-type transport system permease subunit